MVLNLSRLSRLLVDILPITTNNLTDNINFFLRSDGTIDKKTLRETIKEITVYSEKQETIELQTNLATLTRHLNQFILYYDYYTKDEDDTKTTVLRVLGVDNLTFTNLFVKLKEFQSFITANSSNITVKQLKNLSKEYSLTIENAFYIQGELQMFNNIPQDKKNYYESNKLSDEDVKVVTKVEKVINDFLASQFVTATIDLKKAGIKEGEILSITMLWSKSFKTKSDNEFDPLTIASFQVKELGWRLNVASSIILVNRPSIDDNNPPKNYSPTRFKGSPGVSLLATYTGLKERSGAFLERLSPSLGLNVSYLDFDTSKDVEIGAGLIAGFFRNRVFFTWGFNLNVPDKSQYIGLGFSFAEIIAEVVKPSKKSGD